MQSLTKGHEMEFQKIPKLEEHQQGSIIVHEPSINCKHLGQVALSAGN